MRRIAALFALVLLLLAACGDEDVGTDEPDEPVTTSPVHPTPGRPDDGADGTEPGPPIVSPEPGLLDPRLSAVESAVVLDGAGDEVEVRFYNGVEECYGLDHVEVEETDGQVTIGVYTGGRPPGDQVCIEIALLQATIVTLDAPLGDRVLIDASTGDAVAVG